MLDENCFDDNNRGLQLTTTSNESSNESWASNCLLVAYQRRWCLTLRLLVFQCSQDPQMLPKHWLRASLWRVSRPWRLCFAYGFLHQDQYQHRLKATLMHSESWFIHNTPVIMSMCFVHHIHPYMTQSKRSFSFVAHCSSYACSFLYREEGCPNHSRVYIALHGVYIYIYKYYWYIE